MTQYGDLVLQRDSVLESIHLMAHPTERKRSKNLEADTCGPHRPLYYRTVMKLLIVSCLYGDIYVCVTEAIASGFSVFVNPCPLHYFSCS